MLKLGEKLRLRLQNNLTAFLLYSPLIFRLLLYYEIGEGNFLLFSNIIIAFTVFLTTDKYAVSNLRSFLAIIIPLLMVITVEYWVFNVTQIALDVGFYIVVPLFVFSMHKNYEKLIYSLALWGILMTPIFILDPLYNYALTIDYMAFSWMLIVPSFVFVLYSDIEAKFKLFFLLTISIFGIVFGARSVLIIMIFNVFLRYGFKFLNKWVVLSSVVLIYYGNSIIALAIGKGSYSVRRLQKYINGSNEDVSSGRYDIWSHNMSEFSESPFEIRGLSQISYSERVFTHNIFLELFMSYGILGMILSILVILLIIYTVVNAAYLGKLFLGLWFPKLLFSSTVLHEPYFWIWIYLTILYLKNDKSTIRKSF